MAKAKKLTTEQIAAQLEKMIAQIYGKRMKLDNQVNDLAELQGFLEEARDLLGVLND